MTVVVRNGIHNIKAVYNNVEDVIKGFAGMFKLFLENGETATFHYVDDDGSNWNYFIK